MNKTKIEISLVVRIAALAMIVKPGFFPALARTAGSMENVPGALHGYRLVSPVAAGQWIMPAGDYGNTRYSPLDKIDTHNVQNLHVVTTISTGIPQGHEGQPLVVTTRCTW